MKGFLPEIINIPSNVYTGVPPTNTPSESSQTQPSHSGGVNISGNNGDVVIDNINNAAIDNTAIPSDSPKKTTTATKDNKG